MGLSEFWPWSPTGRTLIPPISPPSVYLCETPSLCDLSTPLAPLYSARAQRGGFGADHCCSSQVLPPPESWAHDLLSDTPPHIVSPSSDVASPLKVRGATSCPTSHPYCTAEMTRSHCKFLCPRKDERGSLHPPCGQRTTESNQNADCVA